MKSTVLTIRHIGGLKPKHSIWKGIYRVKTYTYYTYFLDVDFDSGLPKMYDVRVRTKFKKLRIRRLKLKIYHRGWKHSQFKSAFDKSVYFRRRKLVSRVFNRQIRRDPRVVAKLIDYCIALEEERLEFDDDDDDDGNLD